jgi:D-threo-aldose 1-dehydrogenase
MNIRPLGRTGLQISVLGLGGGGIANLYRPLSDEEAVAVIHAALDHGIRYIDTAPLYGAGMSERRIGLALERHPAGAECVVATKIGYVPEEFDFSFEATVRSVEASCERLRLARIPLVQIHELQPANWDAVMAPRGALAALRHLRETGIIGHIGATASDLATLQRALTCDVFETLFVWKHFHLLDDANRPILDEAARRGIGVIIGTPFAGGILASGTGPGAHYFYRPAPEEIQARVRPIEELCRAVGVSLRAVALQFCLRHPAVAGVVAGADTPVQVAENVAALAEQIPEDFWTRLEALGLDFAV